MAAATLLCSRREISGCQMYIPSDQMLDEGGYEVVSYYEYHQPAGLAPGIDSAVTDGVRELQRYGVG